MNTIKYKILCLLFVFCSIFGIAQQLKHTISGTIKDEITGETLIGTIISVGASSQFATGTNEYGFYSLTLAKGTYTIYVRFAGYKTDTLYVLLERDIVKNITLSASVSKLDEVIIVSEMPNWHSELGIEKAKIEVINKLPVIFGEQDIIKSLTLLPGIKSISEGNNGISIRGGSTDQNLILIDEAPVYNASHLLGFFSAFNSDAIKSLTVYKGTQQAQFGSRLSSVIDIRTKDGNKHNFEVNSSLGLISSKLSIEGPVLQNKSSFFISARRTYIDQFLKFSKDELIKKSIAYFYDLNAKLDFRINDKNVLYFSGYLGKDKIRVFESFGLYWGNNTSTIRLNHVLNQKCFSNTSIIFSDYNYVSDVENSGNSLILTSGIRNYSIKQEFQYFISTNKTIYLGYNSIFHSLIPGRITEKNTSVFTNRGLQNRNAWENSIYVSYKSDMTSWLSISAGLRISAFSVIAAGDFYSIDKSREVIDTLSYRHGQFVKTYINPEPRFSANFILNEKTSIKTSVNRNSQNLHLISINTGGNPSDKWVPSNNNIKPEIADQISVGCFRHFCKDMFEAVVEGYYKRLLNQIDYKDGADVFSNNAIESQLLVGIGRAYGVEFCFKKHKEKFTGWLSYTLSRTERRINGINHDNWYAARYDKTHDIAIVICYDLNKRFEMSANWVFSTGNAVTLPTGKYYIENEIVWMYSERNGYRMPNHHRLDIMAKYKLKKRKHTETNISLGLYNAYGRNNAYSISFNESEINPGTTEIEQLSLFKWVPAFTINCKFI